MSTYCRFSLTVGNNHNNDNNSNDGDNGVNDNYDDDDDDLLFLRKGCLHPPTNILKSYFRCMFMQIV